MKNFSNYMPLENGSYDPNFKIQVRTLGGFTTLGDVLKNKPNGQTVTGGGGKPPIEIKPSPITGNPTAADIFNIKPLDVEKKADHAALSPEQIAFRNNFQEEKKQALLKEKQVGSGASFLGGSTVTLFVILIIIGTIIYFKTKSK